jgi:Asp-tRNA(Asn)/Glu-tRNA(Gln) amidotransferase A subunit family amidase
LSILPNKKILHILNQEVIKNKQRNASMGFSAMLADEPARRQTGITSTPVILMSFCSGVPCAFSKKGVPVGIQIVYPATTNINHVNNS